MVDKICFIISMLHKNHPPFPKHHLSMCLGGDWESCTQESKACFVQICIWNKYQPFKNVPYILQRWQFLKASPQHLLLQTIRGAARPALRWQQQVRRKHEAKKSQQLNLKIISKHPCFAKEIKLVKPLKMLTNSPDRVLKQSWDP